MSDKAPPAQRIDIEGITLVWGDRARWKAELRSESARRHLGLPIHERLLAALQLVLPRRARP